MELTLAIDFGSTYTKVVALDLTKEELVGVAQAPSTVDTDMTISLHAAVDKLCVQTGLGKIQPDRVLGSSSAAGGLRVVAAGLVQALTTKAAQEAALGAGAKLVGSYANGLSEDDVREIEEIAPDMILLTGGTDGGNKDCLIHNAALLAESTLVPPFIIAGNKRAASEARALLEKKGKEALVVENVLPELDVLNVEPARAAIRDVFMRRIVRGKGLDKARAFVGDILMPTPSAVLLGARLVAEGAGDESGLGELVVVDVGGATTDVDSIAHGLPSGADVVVKGLAEPYMKRTVEGDLGIRYNADTILEKAGKRKIVSTLAAMDGTLVERINLEATVANLSAHIDTVPQDDAGYCLDVGLACTAVELAMERHCGKIEEVYFPTGKARIQHGKDLGNIQTVIGTGGVFAYGRGPRRILEACCQNTEHFESLRPQHPDFYIDEKYILFAVGLLAEIAPEPVLRIIKRHLKRV